MKKTWEKPTLDTLEMKMTYFRKGGWRHDSSGDSGDSGDSGGDKLGS